MNIENTIDYCARASAYRFIGVFLSLPDETIVRGIDDGSAAADLRDILTECGFETNLISRVSDLFSEADPGNHLLSRLRQDYTRLFTNPEKPLIPIYEALFKKTDDFDTSGLVFISPTALDAGQAYKRFDLEVDPQKHDSPDHMGAEMDFMCYLYFNLAEAVAQKDRGTVQKLEDTLRLFKEEHTSKWAADFFSRVEAVATTPQYRAIGMMGYALACREHESETVA